MLWKYDEYASYRDGVWENRDNVNEAGLGGVGV